MRFAVVCCGLSLAFNALAANKLGILPDGERYVKGQIIVGLDHSTSNLVVGQSFLQGKVKRVYPAIHAVLLVFPTNLPISALLSRLGHNQSVLFAEPDVIYHAADYVPNDPDWSSQWGPERIDCPKAWDFAKSDSSTLVAIIDSGVNYNHPDLSAHYAGGTDFQDNDSDPMDVDGHGTHVAGIAAAVPDNGLGIAGVAFNSRFLAIRVGTNNTFPESNIIAGINWAVTNGAHVINMSLGGYGYSSAMQLAIDSAWSSGVVVCCAAGNDSTTQQFYPAAMTNCIAVAATTGTNTLAQFSNRGTWVDIAAPGSGIYSTEINGYGLLSGTSMASPMVAGTAALLYQSIGGVRNLTNAATVRAAIQDSAIDFTQEISGGRLDTYLAALLVYNVPPSWVSQFSDQAWSEAIPSEIVIDTTGNSFMSLRGTGNGNDVAILRRYGPTGTVAWSHPLLPNDQPTALALAGTNLWLAKNGFQILRFDTVSGALQNTWGLSQASPVDFPSDLAVDSLGNAVILGPISTNKFLLGKVANPGGVQWQTQFDTIYPYKSCLVKTDGQNNIYTSTTQKPPLGCPVAVALTKFTPSGSVTWEKVIGTQPCPIVITQDGLDINAGGNQIAITGTIQLQGNVPPARYLYVYDNNGNISWQWLINANGGPPASMDAGGLSFDPTGALVVLATEYNNGTSHYAIRVIKYAPNGALVWDKTYNLPDSAPPNINYTNRPQFDSAGNVYVCAMAQFPNGTKKDSITVKFNSNGKLMWASRYPGVAANFIVGNLMVVSPGGTVILAGTSEPTITTQGNTVFSYQVPGGGNTATGSVGGHVDLDGYVGNVGLVGEIEIREPATGTVLSAGNVNIGVAGDYVLAEMPTGVYDISLKCQNWLRQTIHNVTVAKGAVSLDFALINGDADWDNLVSLPDLNEVFVDFGTDDADGGDLDHDGLVGLPDLNFTLVYFGTQGDP